MQSPELSFTRDDIQLIEEIIFLALPQPEIQSFLIFFITNMFLVPFKLQYPTGTLYFFLVEGIKVKDQTEATGIEQSFFQLLVFKEEYLKKNILK